MPQVYYRGELVQAEKMSGAGQVFWQIGREYVPDWEVAQPESPRYTPESPPPPPPGTLTEGGGDSVPDVAPMARKRKGAKAPVVAGDDDPPKGGELSEEIPDPRNR